VVSVSLEREEALLELEQAMRAVALREEEHAGRGVDVRAERHQDIEGVHRAGRLQHAPAPARQCQPIRSWGHTHLVKLNCEL
jgi:hypothetical protein